MRANVLFWSVILIVLFLDQASKAWVEHTWTEQGLGVGDSLPVIPGVFHITLTHNTGIAFGLLPGKGGLTTPLSLIVMLGILWYRKQVHPSARWLEISLGLLFGGALSNLIDRLRFHYVRDLFDFQFWPVFNVADTAITCAILIIFVSQFFRRSDDEGTQEGKEA